MWWCGLQDCLGVSRWFNNSLSLLSPLLLYHLWTLLSSSSSHFIFTIMNTATTTQNGDNLTIEGERINIQENKKDNECPFIRFLVIWVWNLCVRGAGKIISFLAIQWTMNQIYKRAFPYFCGESVNDVPLLLCSYERMYCFHLNHNVLGAQKMIKVCRMVRVIT